MSGTEETKNRVESLFWELENTDPSAAGRMLDRYADVLAVFPDEVVASSASEDLDRMIECETDIARNLGRG